MSKLKRGDWICGCGQHNFYKKETCLSCRTPRPRISRRSPSPNEDFDGNRRVDWNCSVCGELNFANRQTCRRCIKGTDKPPPYKKQGDWNCSVCGELNFANRQTCRRCPIEGTGKPPFLAAKKPGDWDCRCGELNFAVRTNCRKCGQSKEGPVPQQAPLIQHWRMGDWECSVCSHMNFAKNQCCRICKTVPSLVSGHGGKWACTCGELNFARNTTCRKCGLNPQNININNMSNNNSSDSSSKNSNNNSNDTSNNNINNNSNDTSSNDTSSNDTSNNNSNNNDNTNTPNEEDDGNNCVVCMSATAEVAIIVCGHLALCMDCASKLKSCPLCRVPYTPTQILKIFQAGI